MSGKPKAEWIKFEHPLLSSAVTVDNKVGRIEFNVSSGLGVVGVIKILSKVDCEGEATGGAVCMAALCDIERRGDERDCPLGRSWEE